MTEETQVEPSRDEIIQAEPAPVEAAPEPAPEPVEAPPPPPVETPTSTGFTVWDVATGQIVSFGQCSPYVVAAQAAEGQDYVDVAYDDSLYWMPAGVPTLRPDAPAIPAQAITGTALDMPNVTQGAEVRVLDSFGVEQTFAFDIDDPLIFVESGTYTVAIKQAFPHQNAVQEVTVTDA